MAEKMKTLAMSLMLVTLAAGCATQKKDSRSFFLNEPLEIMLVDESEFEAIGIENFGSPTRGVYFPSVRIIMVRYSYNRDKDGNYLPDFEALGHELYHALAGDFHSE